MAGPVAAVEADAKSERQIQREIGREGERYSGLNKHAYARTCVRQNIKIWRACTRLGILAYSCVRDTLHDCVRNNFLLCLVVREEIFPRHCVVCL